MSIIYVLRVSVFMEDLNMHVWVIHSSASRISILSSSSIRWHMIDYHMVEDYLSLYAKNIISNRKPRLSEKKNRVRSFLYIFSRTVMVFWTLVGMLENKSFMVTSSLTPNKFIFKSFFFNLNVKLRFFFNEKILWTSFCIHILTNLTFP